MIVEIHHKGVVIRRIKLDAVDKASDLQFSVVIRSSMHKCAEDGIDKYPYAPAVNKVDPAEMLPTRKVEIKNSVPKEIEEVKKKKVNVYDRPRLIIPTKESFLFERVKGEYSNKSYHH